MIKYLSLLSCFLILISCTPSDKSSLTFTDSLVPPTYDVDKLLNGWSYDTVTYNGTTYLYDHNENCNRDFFGFRNNEGQRYQYEEFYFTNTYCTTNQTVLRWEPNGNHLNLYFGVPLVASYEVLSLTDTAFIFARDIDVTNDGVNEHVIITTIPYDPYNSFGPVAGKLKLLQNTNPKKKYAILPKKSKQQLRSYFIE